MENNTDFLTCLFEVSHVEFQSYDLSSHKLLFSSGIASKILGYTADEYSRLSENFFIDIIHPEDRQKVVDAINAIIHAQDAEIVELTIRARRKDGAWIWAYSRQMVCERDETGAPKKIIRVVEDISSYMVMQEELKEKTDQIFAISYKNSHLLRSPVASIIGLVNLIEEKNITSEHNRQIFNYLKRAINKLDNVIHEINDSANIKNDKY